MLGDVAVSVREYIYCLKLSLIYRPPVYKFSYNLSKHRPVRRLLKKGVRNKELGPELFCLLLGPPRFNCWFSFAPVFQWCCSTPQGSPGVGCNTLFLSSPHLYFIIVFIHDLIVSRDDPLMS